MKFGEIIETVDKPFKVITPDGYVGYYQGHTEGTFAVHIVWLSMKPNSKRQYPYHIPLGSNIQDWEVTTKEECNIEELFKIKK